MLVSLDKVCYQILSWSRLRPRPPANTGRWPNVGLMLGQRRRRWHKHWANASCLLGRPVPHLGNMPHHDRAPLFYFKMVAKKFTVDFTRQDILFFNLSYKRARCTVISHRRTFIFVISLFVVATPDCSMDSVRPIFLFKKYLQYGNLYYYKLNKFTTSRILLISHRDPINIFNKARR